jgi:hypothetical protein
MLDTSIITGKAYTGNPSASNSIKKRLYLKIFPGEFWYRAPRPKKAKVYGGELFVRYSGREWPEKKNGPLVGDPGLLSGISDLLKELNLVNVEDLSYAKIQHNLKEVLTLSVGPELAKEIVDRGWASLNDLPEVKIPKIASNEEVSAKNDTSEVITIGEAVMMPVEEAKNTDTDENETQVVTQTESIEQLYGKKKVVGKKKSVSTK